ncbi:hypothetical protein KP509_21G066200 [Ceratopteris richardii]|uniref:HTH La-type RNA-binding domain-containing protein n=1 Tax=Ceratopteris richardii TaxID=49495 RepID=A0A8T2SCN8_CERRI|nr:hypothetical protein KP509_21G066200 [Ceratopteris richardii]
MGTGFRIKISDLQGLRSLHLADGPQYHQGWRHSPVFELQQPTKHNSRMQEMDNSTSSQLMNDSLLHDVNYGGGFPNQNKKWRDIRRRGNFEWPNHGRGNGKGSDVITVLDEQHIGQRNMHWPPQPPLYMNTSFAFLNGVMHYVPIGVPVPVQFIPHFHPVVSPDIMVPANMDLKAANSALIKQINYYFSEENLMKDCYLREHMDGEGFVPISLIARFNRVRINLSVILNALHHSTVVEVQVLCLSDVSWLLHLQFDFILGLHAQHDRIRRRNDGGKWRLQPGQRSAVLSVEDNISLRNLREGFHRETEQACNGGLTSSLEESMAQTSSNRPERAVPDAGSTPEKCEHINHNGESVLLDAKKGATALLQHFPGSGSSIQRSSFIDDNTVAILASHELATREVST